MEAIVTPNFPLEKSAYSPAVRVGDTLYVSGQVPLDSATGNVIGDDITSQTRKTFSNLEALLGHCGLSLADVAKVTIYLSDIEKIGEMNQEYARILGDHKPARACVEVSRIALDMMIEVEAVAIFPEGNA